MNMKKIFSLILLVSVLFITTSCFNKKESEENKAVAPDYSISTSTWGWWGTPVPEWATRK